MPIHDPDNWTHKDGINDAIWSDSARRQRVLAARFPTEAPGSVGGQQAMFPGPPDARGTGANPLPWVPDLIGKKSGKANQNPVMIIGSAYAPFVEGYSQRHFPLLDYQEADNWGGFQTLFLTHVVTHDAAYYDKFERFFGANFCWERTIVTDWCRASFVRRADEPENGEARHDQGGDTICDGEGAGVFFHYVEQNLDWHFQRIKGFKGKIVLLGNLSRKCLSFACHAAGWSISYHGVADHIDRGRPDGLARFWTPAPRAVVGTIHRGNDQDLEFTAIKHPSNQMAPEEIQTWNLRILGWVG